MKIFIIHKSEYGPGQAYRSKLLVIKKLWYFVMLGIRHMIASYWFKTFFYRLRIKDFTDLHQLVYNTQTYAHVSQRIVQYMYLKFSFALITYQIKVIPCYYGKLSSLHGQDLGTLECSIKHNLKSFTTLVYCSYINFKYVAFIFSVL